MSESRACLSWLSQFEVCPQEMRSTEKLPFGAVKVPTQASWRNLELLRQNQPLLQVALLNEGLNVSLNL